MAQSTPPPSSGQLEEVIVTSQRAAQNLQDVPVAVSAFTGADIERLQIQSVTDLSRLAPNVKFDPVTGGTAGLKPYVRGGGVSDGGQVTSESEVSIYVDNVYKARLSASLMDFIELDRIEVLRGPQGVLYGRNSSAGAVNIITRAPTETATGTIQLGYGTWNERRAKAFVSGPISKDGRWRASLNGMIRARDGGRQYNATLGKDVGAEDFKGLMADLAYVGESTTARLSLSYIDADSDGQYAVGTVRDASNRLVPRSGSYSRVLSPQESATRIEQYGVTLNLTQDYTGGKLTSITSYSDLSDFWREDFSGGVPGSTAGRPTVPWVALFDRISQTDQNQFTQEVQAAGAFGGGFVNYVGGLYYFTEDGTQNLLTTIFFAPSAISFGISTKSYAAFGQLTFNVTDKLSLIAGGRYTTDEKELRAIVANTRVSLDNSYSRFTPKLGIDYKATDDLLLYASYSEGFKAGGYNGLAGSVAQISTPFRPQVTKAYEAGAKADLFDRTMRLNLSAFYNKVENRQQTATSGTGLFFVENYNVTLKGVEFELSWLITRGLRLWGNGSLNSGEYTGTDSAVATILGNEPPFFPKYQVAAGVDYDIEVAGGTFRLGADYSQRDAYFSTADNQEVGAVKRQDFVNAYVSYERNRWSAQLTAKNLLDEEGWQTGFVFSNSSPRFAIDPRTVLATVRYKY